MSAPETLPHPDLRDSARLGLGMIRDPFTTPMELYRRYGPVVRFGYGRAQAVWLFGREANEYLLATNPDNFLWGPALAPLVPVDGPTALVVSDGEHHRRRRRVVQPAFHRRRVDGYLDTMVEETDRMLDGWTTGRVLDVHAELRRSVRAIVVRCLFGSGLRQRTEALGAALEDALAYVQRPPWRRFDHDWPGTPYRRSQAARRRADVIVYDEILRRRSDEVGHDDVLAWLVAAADEVSGTGLSDQEIRDQAVSLIAAGYDTTSAAAAWAIYAMVQNPAVWARAYEEVCAVGGDRPPTVDTLAAMPYVTGVVSETLRLYSPGAFSGRQAVDSFELLGHRIPARSMVIYSQYVTHRLPDLWAEPERFMPERWVPGDAAYRQPQPYSYVPFGGGHRRCIGFAFAIQELGVIVAEVLRRVQLEAAFTQPIRPTGFATMAPFRGVPVRVVRQT